MWLGCQETFGVVHVTDSGDVEVKRSGPVRSNFINKMIRFEVMHRVD